MINKILCKLWGHVFIKDLEYFSYDFPVQILPGKWTMKSRIITRTYIVCKHCGNVKNVK